MTVALMSDHYEATVTLLEDVDELASDLLAVYEDRTAADRSAQISQLHQDIGRTLKIAHVRSNLAIAQAVHDLGAVR